MQIALPPYPPVIVHWVTAEKPFYEQADVWLSGLTLLLALFTAWVAWETRKMRKGADAAIKLQAESNAAALAVAKTDADAALRGAKAAEAAVNVNARAFQNAQRAWAFCAGATLEDKIGSTLETVLSFENSGLTSASNFHASIAFVVAEIFPTAPSYEDAHETVVTLVPRQSIHRSVSRPLTMVEREFVNAGYQKAFLFGLYRYRDMFDDDHVGRFCYFLNVGKLEWSLHSEHNDMIS